MNLIKIQDFIIDAGEINCVRLYDEFDSKITVYLKGGHYFDFTATKILSDWVIAQWQNNDLPNNEIKEFKS